MKDLLSRKSYRQVVRGLEEYRKKHEADRAENPTSIPSSWGMPLRMMIERIVRNNHERCYRGLADAVLEYLADKGLLVRYAGCYTFPTDESLPSDVRNRMPSTHQYARLRNFGWVCQDEVWYHICGWTVSVEEAITITCRVCDGIK